MKNAMPRRRKYALDVKPPHDGYPAWLRRVTITFDGEPVTGQVQMHVEHAEKLAGILGRARK